MTIGVERYESKRAAGLSDVRADGSTYSPATDDAAFAAEQWAAAIFGCQPNGEVYADHGDDGFDFVVSVDVKHLGLVDGQPRRTGNLIVNQGAPTPGMYLVVAGSSGVGFELIGWITGRRFEVERRLVDFGYGQKWSLPVSRLNGVPRAA